MIINLDECAIRYINLDSNTVNNKQFLNMASLKNLKDPLRIPGILTDDPNEYYVGLAEAYHNALGSIGSRVPTIIFEDDAVPTNEYKNTISIPGDADAVYLGLSAYGYNGYTPENKMLQVGRNILLQPYEVNGYPNVYKIKNALATHAILYISKRSISLAKEIVKRSFTTEPSHIDFALTELQEKLNVYAVGPLFHQFTPGDPRKAEINSVTVNVRLDVLSANRHWD